MLVRVFNDNSFLYSEKYKGKVYDIQPGASVEMEEDDAEHFLSQYTPVVKRGDNTPDPRFFKMLRIDPPLGSREHKANPLMVHAAGKVAANAEEFEALTKMYAHSALRDKESEAQDMSSVKAQMEAQQAEIAELKALVIAATTRKPRRKKEPTSEPQIEEPLDDE